MSTIKKTQSKSTLHARNKNKERYDLRSLINVEPKLNECLILNKNGEETIDFANPNSVLFLNRAILNYYYGITKWDFPSENLCPPIPGRAEYIHNIADLLSESNYGKIPVGEHVKCLDIGVGANCIYPIIGISEYKWHFTGADVETKSIESSENIIRSNEALHEKAKFRLQKNTNNIFRGVIKKPEKFDLTICNPPFHSSITEAVKGTQRKNKNLTGKKITETNLKLSGVNKELVCEGGEIQFIKQMIKESLNFSTNCFWFSTLVSKQSNLKGIYKLLERMKPTAVKTIPIGTGNKSTRIVAWTFLTNEEQKEWRDSRWKK